MSLINIIKDKEEEGINIFYDNPKTLKMFNEFANSNECLQSISPANIKINFEEIERKI